MTQIEKIRQEIERLAQIDYPCDTAEQADGFYDALDRITYFIDSLEEEEKKVLEDFAPGTNKPEIAGKDFVPVDWVETLERYGKWRIVKVEQEPQGLDKAAEEWYTSVKYLSDLSANPINAFKAGAKWHSEQAEEERALTAQDVGDIICIGDELCNEWGTIRMHEEGQEAYYTEVLRRFNEQKNRQ